MREHHHKWVKCKGCRDRYCVACGDIREHKVVETGDSIVHSITCWCALS